MKKELKRKNSKDEPTKNTVQPKEFLAKQILEMKIDNEDGKESLKLLGYEDGESNVATAILLSAAKDAMGGNIRSAEYLFNLAEGYGQGGKTWSGIPAGLIGKGFVDVYREICDAKADYFYFKGGRGSLKSSFCALVMVDQIMRKPNICAVILRQVMETMRDSVFAQIQWAVEMLGLDKLFKFSLSPMSVKRLDTGQQIYFRGADDPAKIKSIRPPKGMHIGAVWFEEMDQFKGEEEIRSILQSLIRGGDEQIVLGSFNTPMSRTHFLNKMQNDENNERIFHSSYYYDVPENWLGKAFLKEAERLKKANERAYKHEYLGEPVGNGAQVFDKILIRNIPDEEINSFDRINFGLDWGWFPDPTAFVKCAYHKGLLYIFDEFEAYKTSNFDIGERIKAKGMGEGDLLICDSSEPKSIAELITYGINAKGAEKRPGSLNFSMRWLQGIEQIVIDPAKCPNSLKEFSSYEYEKTRSGEIISAFPDKNNHFIDAVRYATNLIWRK